MQSLTTKKHVVQNDADADDVDGFAIGGGGDVAALLLDDLDACMTSRDAFAACAASTSTQRAHVDVVFASL